MVRFVVVGVEVQVQGHCNNFTGFKSQVGVGVEVQVGVEVESKTLAYGPVGSGDTSRTSAVITNVTLPDFATCAR